MSALPNAVPQNPACGACGIETRWHVLGYQCEECLLVFDDVNSDLAASFLNPDAEPCGVACDNYWHGDHKDQAGTRLRLRDMPTPIRSHVDALRARNAVLWR